MVEATAFSLPQLTGFENHGGITELGPDARPLGRVVAGSGNGAGGVEGVVQGRVVGSYLHGPCLARNPALADLLLSWVVGEGVVTSIPARRRCDRPVLRRRAPRAARRRAEMAPSSLQVVIDQPAAATPPPGGTIDFSSM